MKKLFTICLFTLLANFAFAQKVTFQINYGMYSTGSNLLDWATTTGGFTVPETGFTKELNFEKALASYGAEATIYIIKGWGVNVGYAYSNSKIDDFLSSSDLARPKLKMHQFNLGVAKKMIKLPFFSLSGIAGINVFTNSVDNIIVLTKDNPTLDELMKMETKSVTDTKYGLDLGLNARIAFLSAGLKYDFVRKYVKFGIGAAF